MGWDLGTSGAIVFGAAVSFPRRFSRTGIPFEEIAVYETHPMEYMDFSDATRPEWALFFSPSAVQSMVTAQGMDWGPVRKAAIGPTTAAAVEMVFGQVDAVAQAPASEAMTSAVKQVDNK